MDFPVLYKKDMLGRIRFWEIWSDNNTVNTRYGLDDGYTDSQSSYEILIGKNIGKSNETTVEEQADLEAAAKHKSKVEDGWFTNRLQAEEENITYIGEGGIKPMKCQKYESHAHRIKYPCYVQPKLDGLRCIAVKVQNTVTLYSSGGKVITTMEHINNEILNTLSIKEQDIILDGELYKHGMPLNEINGIVSAKINKHGTSIREQISYYIFDIVEFGATFEKRKAKLDNIKVDWPLYKVPTIVNNSPQEATNYYSDLIAIGYEGIIYRNKDLIYQQGRSYDIIKRKNFIEEDFKIIGINNGKGIFEDKAATLTLVTKDGQEFDPGINVDHNLAMYMLQHPEEYIGKYATCRFLNYGVNKVPVIPRVITIRDEEGLDLCKKI